MPTVFELVAPTGSSAASVTWNGRCAIFSRPADNEILAHNPSDESTVVLRRHTGGVTGLTATTDGKIFGCQTLSRRMVLYHEDGSTTVPCDQLDGVFHNFPIYASADGKGRVWFADPPLELRTPGPQVFPPLEHGSILRLEPSTDGWALRRMTYQTRHPSVVAVSPDGRLVYVADNVGSEQALIVHAIEGETIGEGKTILRLPVDNGAPPLTGLDVATNGTLVLATTDGVVTMSPEGTFKTSVDTGERPTDVAIIDEGSILATTDGGGLLRIDGAIGD